MKNEEEKITAEKAQLEFDKYFISAEEAGKRAIQEIELERTGKQLGLFCRFDGLNRAKNKYWRQGRVTLIAGLSGHCKSYLLNFLEEDFTNTELNGNFHKEVAVLSFKYEMEAKDEVLRTVAGHTGHSYNYLLSSEMNKATSDYNKITNDELVIVEKTIENKIKNRKIYYNETAGSIVAFVKHCNNFKLLNPDIEVVATLDHTLLTLKENNQSDLDIQSAMARAAIVVRKKVNANVILLNQLNGEIERMDRRSNNAFHFPIKTDIHCGNQIYWACDDIMTIHCPELLGIERYSNARINTKGLIHIGVIKVRRGNLGNIFLKNELQHGKFSEFTANEIENLKTKKEENIFSTMLD